MCVWEKGAGRMTGPAFMTKKVRSSFIINKDNQSINQSIHIKRSIC